MQPPRFPRALVAAVTLAVAATGLARLGTAAPSASSAPRSVRVLEITAKDYAFDAPDTVGSGRTEVRLVNQGPDLHHAYLIRLDDGKTAADFGAALKAGGPPPAWAHDEGGPNTPVPGGTSSTIVDLQPGTYVITCVIPAADGMMHAMKGMSRVLTVVPAASLRANLVAKTASLQASRGATMFPDMAISLKDYAFDVKMPVVAGQHLIRVRNDAEQSHEVLFVKLAPGRTPMDVAKWVEKPEGPPPGAPIGGTVSLAKGVSNDVLLTLEPGEYGMLCFVPDATDGKPHVMHGMMRQFSVR